MYNRRKKKKIKTTMAALCHPGSKDNDRDGLDEHGRNQDPHRVVVLWGDVIIADD